MNGDGNVRKLVVVILGLVLIDLCLMSGCTEKKPQGTSGLDTDGDGYNDTVDAFSTDPTEWKDSDSDGVGDNADAFPYDANETKDSDGDSVGDNADAFPLDPTEWKDSDGDGVGDNADYYPYDPTRWERPPPDAFLQRAEPYLEKLAFNDSTLQTYADPIIYGVDATKKESRMNALYRDVLMNYTCTSAPMNNSTVQTPQETISKKNGTCEDLSILLCSLLYTIGIPSSLVFTNNHVYVLASGINTDMLWGVAEQSLIHQVEKRFGEPLTQQFVQTYTLPPLNMLYIGGGEGQTFAGVIDSMAIDYTISSDNPVDLYIVSSQTEFFHLQNDPLNFTWLVREMNFTSKTGSTQLTTYGGVILINGGASTATVNTDFLFRFQPSFYGMYNKNKLTAYNLGGSVGVLLDPSLGEYGFPGYDAEIIGEKTAIDPVTKEYVTLN
jgi:hypothetical protein